MNWETQIQVTKIHPLIAFAGGGSRARRSRLQRFCDWQQTTQGLWYLPNLLAWRDNLLEDEQLTATSVRAYLSTVRSAYRHILRSNELRQWLYNQLDSQMPPERKLALISEFMIQLKNAIDPDNAPVRLLTVQDEADDVHHWLNPSQVAALIQAPGLDNLLGLRDSAILALLLCTGIRAAELVDLDVSDLRSRLGSALALKVRAGKGFKQRLVPYGAQDWVLNLVDAWLETAGLAEGPAFVGLRKGSSLYLDKQGRPSRLAVNAIGEVLRRYPITIDGRLQQVKPHDLRRTYARQLYLIGTDLAAIQQNLGHER
jgi:integrase/recombinase XerD